MTEEQRNQVSLSILVKINCNSSQVLNCFSLSQPPYHPRVASSMETFRQQCASTEIQKDLQRRATCATPMVLNNHPGLPLTMASLYKLKGWRSSTVRIAVEKERKTLRCGSQMSSLPLPARCSLVVLSLANLLDLAQMGNI